MPIATNRALLGGQRVSLIDGLTAFWKLDEASGQRNDVVGANHLTDNNTVTQTTGKIGNAARMAAANSEYLSIADNASLAVPGSFSFAGWMRNTANPGGGGAAVFSKWAINGANQAGDEYFLISAGFGANTAQWVVRQSDGVQKTAAIGGLLTTNAWDFVYVYFNSGVEIGISINNGTVTTTAVTTAAIDQTGALALELGKWGSSYADIDLDAWGFWNGRILTAAEVTYLFNNGSGREYPFT